MKLRFVVKRVDGNDDEVADTIQYLHHATFFDTAPKITTDYGDWWLVFDEHREPIAFAGMVPSTLGPGIGYLKRVGVLPEYRGQGLQRRLIRVREMRAKQHGWYRLVTDTTDNVPSANSLIKAGYRLFDPGAHWWGFAHSLYWTKNLR